MEKLIKQFGNSLFLREPPPLFLCNFFMTPLFVQLSKGELSRHEEGGVPLVGNSTGAQIGLGSWLLSL